MELPVAITVGAVVFATFVFMAVFRHLKPDIVKYDYVACVGGWHEAYLNECDPDLKKIPQQPVNAYTNLAFLAAGCFVHFSLNTPESFTFLVTTTYLCIGSTLYHGTSTHWGGMLDVTGIYAVFSGLAAYSALALIGVGTAVTVLLILVVAGLAAYFLSKHFRRDMHLKIAIFLGITYILIVVRMWIAGDWSDWVILAVSLGLYAVAFLIWNMDRAKTFRPKGWGHGFWHILCAAASALVFWAIHSGVYGV